MDLSTLSNDQLLALYREQAPLGVRNNNPLNLKGGDGQFRAFPSQGEGLAAADANLAAYGSKHGINTISGVVSRWAPEEDGNDPAAYAAFVGQRTGMHPEQAIDLADPTTRRTLLTAMSEFENGEKVLPEQQDLSQLSDAELLDLYGQHDGAGQAGPPPAAPEPAGPATIKSVGGKIVFGDTGDEVPELQAKTIRQLAAGGLLKDGEAGSESMPFVQRSAEDQFAPGQFYIEARTGKLRQVPGGADQGGAGAGFMAGLGDIPNSIMKLLPGHEDSDIFNAAEARRLRYDAKHEGDTAAAVGRFGGQVAGSLPLLAGAELGVGALASKAPSAWAPAMEFLAGRGGTGFLGKTASRFARGAPTGAAATALVSGASDEPLPQQLAEGAVIGGAANATLVPALAWGGKRLAGMIGSKFRPADEIDPAALQYVASKVGPKITPTELRAMDPRLTAAEGLGTRGEVAVGALARRNGETGDDLARIIAARSGSRGEQLLHAISKASGVEPDATRGLVERMVQQGRTEADPLYAAAFDDRPMWNPKLEELARRSSVKDAMKTARWMMGEEGKSAETLGMDFVENPEQWASYVPPPLQAAEAANPVGFLARARGPARAPSQGPSLLKFIADNGGIDDMGGDVAAMGGDQWHMARAYQRRLIGDVQPDYMAQRAFEAGYFPQNQEAPTINELYDAIGRELRGKALYARPADEAALQRFTRANMDEELAYRGGDPADVPSPEQYVGRPMPTSEPAHQMVPKTQTWDYIKRAIDDELVPYLSGKLEWTDKARLMNQTRAAMVDELQNLNPQYRSALEASGDYLGAQRAFRDGRRMILDQNTDSFDFRKRLEGMGKKELRFFQAGIANQALQLVQTAWTQPTRMMNAFRTPLVEQKLKMALGEKRASALLKEIDLQVRMKGFEQAVGTRANSITSQMSAEMAAQDAGGEAAQLGAHVVSGALAGGPKGGAMAAVGHVVRKAADLTRTAGLPMASRDAAGKILLGTPEDLAALLEQANAKAATRRRPLPGVRSGLIGGAAMMRPKDPSY